MFGEAMIILRPELASHAKFVRKQLLQLNSKMRFCAAQFEALLSENLWLFNARNANAMATRLRDAVEAIDGVEVVHPVEANAVFARLDRGAIDRLLEASVADHPFYIWDDASNVVRWMCAWDTTAEDVDAFAASVSASLESSAAPG